MKKGYNLFNFYSGKNNRAQVWVETVIYTLIAFALIGAVLGFAKPKIDELQDKALIEQTVQLMEDMHTQIEEIKEVSGNKRLITLNIKKGKLIVDGVNDKLIFELESRYTYTELGKEIVVGSLDVLTTPIGKLNTITLTTNYSKDYDLVFDENDAEKIINPASISHKLFITNRGRTFILQEEGCSSDEECVNPSVDWENKNSEYTSQCIVAVDVNSGSKCKYISNKIKLDFTLG